MVMKILVTGGMGFIGSHLVHHLLKMNHDVVVVDKDIHKPTFHSIAKATIIEADILSNHYMAELLKPVDACVHLAAISSVPLSHRDWLFSHQTNVVGFNQLLDILTYQLPHIRFIYASSAAVYGATYHTPCQEIACPKPCSHYGVDKLSNELYANVMHQCYHYPSLGLRFFNVFGNGQLRDNPYSGVITCFKQAILDSRPLTINGDGEQIRDFIYVHDVVRAIIQGLHSDSPIHGICNVCTGYEMSLNELAITMQRVLNTSLPIHYTERRIGDPSYSAGDPTLARELLGFQAKFSLEEGMKMFLDEKSDR
jgi:UDP-glucose 4-epimerase